MESSETPFLIGSRAVDLGADESVVDFDCVRCSSLGKISKPESRFPNPVSSALGAFTAVDWRCTTDHIPAGGLRKPNGRPALSLLLR